MRCSNLLAVIAIACLAVPATAGLKYPNSGVLVNLSGRSAAGAFGSVQNSANNVESIYCSVTGAETWTAVGCAAVNSANVFAACNISNPPQHMITALSTMGPDSSIRFEWSPTHQCTNITVYTGSTTATKIPPPPPSSLGVVF